MVYEYGLTALAVVYLMQSFYSNLDLLNLAYCCWEEFLLLAQKDYDVARQKLTILEGPTAAHFDGWQLINWELKDEAN